MKKKLFSVTLKDCDMTPYRGSGPGGQKKNKTYSAIRIVHRDSGAIGQCETFREQRRNKMEAFKRMIQTKEFKSWMRVKTAKVTGKMLEIEKKIEKALKLIKIEGKDKNGRWTEMKENKNEN